MAMSGTNHISLRGVRVHNLKAIDLDIPHRKLIVLCGVSGSGKSSLALDTLYAEGQRRYIESFSAYTRQFLQRLEKPEAERIDGIPPAIAVTGRNTSRSSRSTVGTVTETSDYLRLLFAKIGQVFCRQCGREVRRDTPAKRRRSCLRPCRAARVTWWPSAGRPRRGAVRPQTAAALREDGFIRVIAAGRVVDLIPAQPLASRTRLGKWPGGNRRQCGTSVARSAGCMCVVDRLSAGGVADNRLRDSLETAFAKGRGALLRVHRRRAEAGDRTRCPLARPGQPMSDRRSARGGGWASARQLACEDCGIEYPLPEPRLYSFNSPLGACPECEGFGNVIDIDMDLVVPDPNKSLREGAIAPWNTPAYAHELEELLALAGDYGIPVDVPFRELDRAHRAADRRTACRSGSSAGWTASSPGWNGGSTRCTSACFSAAGGATVPARPAAAARLRPEALAARIGGRNIAEICAR